MKSSHYRKKNTKHERTHDKRSNVYSIDLPPAYSHVSYGMKNNSEYSNAYRINLKSKES